MRAFLIGAVGLAGVFFGGSALAAEPNYPNKPVKMIVPFSPGTGVDLTARLIGAKFFERNHQPVVVENRTGVSGHLGAQLVGNGLADGYTVLVTTSNISITASLFPSPTFDAMRDLEPVGIANWANATLVVPTASPYKTLAELLASAKSTPGRLTFGTPGIGSPQHIALEQLQQLTGAQFLHVPYNGMAPAMSDLIAGRVDAMFAASHALRAHLDSGRMRALGVASEHRHRVLPEVPSFKELGVSGFSTDAWCGFLVPKGTPRHIIDKLNKEFAAILAMPDVKAALEKTGVEVKSSSPDEMKAVIQRENAEYGAIIKALNIKVN